MSSFFSCFSLASEPYIAELLQLFAIGPSQPLQLNSTDLFAGPLDQFGDPLEFGKICAIVNALFKTEKKLRTRLL